MEEKFKREFIELLNKYNLLEDCLIPDHIISDYLMRNLESLFLAFEDRKEHEDDLSYKIDELPNLNTTMLD